MKILFIHQNFPGQFKHLAPELVRHGHQVVALGLRFAKPEVWRGVQLIPYQLARGSTPGIHPWVGDFESKVIRAQACMAAALALRNQGFYPDLILAHPGWGESLFLKEVWPQARLAIYGEFYYTAKGADVGFDPEFPVHDLLAEAARLSLKNLNNLMHFRVADAAISPTRWQASTFPPEFRAKITVIHDGIDTDFLVPSPVTIKTIPNLPALGDGAPVITFVNRNLEPYRGYHSFMRCLPELFRLLPSASVLLVGGDGVSYGAKAPNDLSWRTIYFDEVKAQLTPEQLQRIHFVGHIDYESFVSMLQRSTVHVYLTYPFVLSWSLLEAMSCACAIVASSTEPVMEVIKEGETGLLVDFFNYKALASRIAELASDPALRGELGGRARALARAKFDLHRVCLPKQLQWVEELLQS